MTRLTLHLPGISSSWPCRFYALPWQTVTQSFGRWSCAPHTRGTLSTFLDPTPPFILHGSFPDPSGLVSVFGPTGVQGCLLMYIWWPTWQPYKITIEWPENDLVALTSWRRHWYIHKAVDTHVRDSNDVFAHNHNMSWYCTAVIMMQSI